MDNLVIRSLITASDLGACADLMASSEPWLTLGQGPIESLRYFQFPHRERYIATLGERLVGFLVLNFQGPFVGYLQAICLAPDCRGRGLGSALVAFAADLKWVAEHGITVQRYNLGTEPQAFAANPLVLKEMEAGMDRLPIIAVDGHIVSTGVHLSRDQLAAKLGLAAKPGITVKADGSSCCSPKSGCC